MVCFGCDARSAVRGALCDACVSGVHRGRPTDALVRSRLQGSAEAWLADGRGRLHPVSASTRLGRRRTDITIADVSVSREHALLERDGEGWRICDLGSRNGTFVDDLTVEGSAAVRPGARIRFGRAAFLFLVGRPDPSALEDCPDTLTTCQTERQRSYTVHVPHPVPLLLLDARDGGSGVLVEGEAHVNLSLLQLAFLERLIGRCVQDADRPVSVRGYMTSGALLELLPWDAELPDGGHLKQLVRRTRQVLEGTLLTVEGTRGLGYRVWSSGPSPA